MVEEEGIHVIENFCSPFPMAHLWRGLHLEVESTQLTQSSPLCRARAVTSTRELEWPSLLKEFFLTQKEEQFLLQHIPMSSPCFLKFVFLGRVLWEEYASSTASALQFYYS